jgi:predicted MFS family arabinose efflux permease
VLMSNRSTPTSSNRNITALAWKVGAATFSRLVLNTARRFVYPFAPVFSRGLGVPLTAITSMIAVSQATALLGVFSGPLADRWGYRRMMLLGLALLTVGMLAGGFLPFYGVVLAALFLSGLGKSIFDPALQAYVGNRVPFSQRGLVIGLLEFSWAGSTLLGIPLIGFVIHYAGWRASFFALGLGGLMGIAVLGLLISGNRRNPEQGGAVGVFAAWRKLIEQRSSLGALIFAFLVSAANDNLFVVYGAWLEQSFSLSVVALGAGTAVIGIAELGGESLTAAFSDRLGLKRAVVIGVALCVISYGGLPLMRRSFPMALAGLFFIFLTYEFTVVSAMSLCTELLPEFRGPMMSSFMAAAGAGRVVGALIGGSIWLSGGIMMTAAVSAALSGVALIALVWGLWGWEGKNQ